MIAAVVAEEVGLFDELHSLGDDFEAEAVGHGDDGGDDGRGVGIGGDVVDEGLVDLERVDGEAFQVAQRGVAGAEVVE